MTHGVFARGQLTDWIIAELKDRIEGGTPILIGDAVAPKAGGWAGGMPGQGSFTPYAVLLTGEARPASTRTLAQANGDDWTASYMIRSVGALRSQCDWVGDCVREAWVGLFGQRLDLVPPWSAYAHSFWKTYAGDLPTMGQISRNDTTDPPYWELVDQMSVNLCRQRT